MSVLYIKEQGAYVQKAGERIVVTKNAKTLLDLPVIHIDNIALIGNVQITAQALHMLMEKGIDVSYFSFSGRYLSINSVLILFSSLFGSIASSSQPIVRVSSMLLSVSLP